MSLARHKKKCRGLAALAAFGLLTVGLLGAAEVKGVIAITKQITRQRVAPVAGLYHRGAAVGPPAEAGEFSRSELARSAIYLEGGQSSAGEDVTVELKQQSRAFSPETLVIPVGATVSFPNLDPIFHNVFSFSRPSTFDLGNYPKGETRNVTFHKPGIVSVFCHLHSNMSASIVIAPSRWYATPNADGGYSLQNVPPGNYTLVFWHKTAGFFRRRITVAAEAVTVDFTIPVREEDADHRASR
jgi:plastocyanin